MTLLGNILIGVDKAEEDPCHDNVESCLSMTMECLPFILVCFRHESFILIRSCSYFLFVFKTGRVSHIVLAGLMLVMEIRLMSGLW